MKGINPQHPQNHMLKKATYTPAEIKLAYQLVSSDLLNSLKKLKPGEQTRLGSLGAITKSYKQMKSKLDNNYYGFYQLSLRMFPSVKRALEQN